MVHECSLSTSTQSRYALNGSHNTHTDARPHQEYTKRPRKTGESPSSQRYHTRHIVHPSSLTLRECLAHSDVVVSAVPSAEYKVKTEWLKDGCICLNVAADKNFEKDVREKVMNVPRFGIGAMSVDGY